MNSLPRGRKVKMGKLLANQIRGINPLAKKGVLLLWAFLLSFAYVVGVKDASAAPTTTGGNNWTLVRAVTNAALSINATSTTAITPGAGANRLLLVAVHIEKATASATTLDATPTFGGVPLMPIADNFARSTRMQTYMGFLPHGSILTGAQNVNFQATSAVGNITGIQIYVAVYTGVDQSTPISASSENATAAVNVSILSALSFTADSITVLATGNGGAAATLTTTQTGGSAFTQRATSTTGAFSGYVRDSATNANAGSYSALTATYAGTTSTRSSLVAASLKAYVSSSDVTKPVVNSFTAPSSSTSTLITGITMAATDDTGVTGYGITESATPPLPSLLTSATPLTTYTAASAGTKTLYAWAKDAAGNVSNVFTAQTVTITLPPKPTRAVNWTSLYGAVAYPNGNLPTAFNVPAGQNRLLVVTIASTRTTVGNQAVSNVTWGGRPLTLAAGNGTLATIWNHSYIYYLKEADIATATGTTMTATIANGTAYYTRIYAAVYTGVDQTNPISSSALYENATANTTVGPFSPTLAVGAQEQAVQVVNLARSTVGTTGRTISTWAAGWTTAGQAPAGIVTSGPCQQVYIRDRAVPTSAVADGSQHTASNTTFDSYAAISIKAAASGLTITTGSAIPAKNVFAGDTNVAVDAFNVVAAAADTITSITFTGSATTTSANVSAVRVYRKVGAVTTAYEAGDQLVASGTFTGNVATMTPSGNNTFSAGTATNFIVVYDIASSAAPNTTVTGNVTAVVATSVSSLVDNAAESAILTIRATTTIGNGTEPADLRLYKGSIAMLDAFTLKQNGTATTDDTITSVTVVLAPAGISGSGQTLSKIGKVEIVNAAGTVSYGSLTVATTNDTWNVPTTGLVATNNETNYYVRITTAANIVPGFYSVSGIITSVVHSQSTSKLVNLDTTSATHGIDTEIPIGPTELFATTPPDADLPTGGGRINLSWNVASDPNGGSLHPTEAYILKRSAAGGTAPAGYCTEGTTAYQGTALEFNDSGLNDTQAPIYAYRVCAKDAQGNISLGTTKTAASSYTNYCNMTPALTLGVEDPLRPGVIQDQLVKSVGGDPFLLQVINNDIGTCPNTTFNIALVETSTLGGGADATPPSVDDFHPTFPASVLLGRTAGPGGTNRTSATVSIFINAHDTVEQIQKFKFKAQVSAAGHGSVTSPFATAILNDMPPIVHNSNNMAKFQYGTWGNEYTCATCHSNSTTNIKGVYEIISTPIGKRNVVFKTLSGNAQTTDALSNDLRTNKDGSNNICSVCHHRTRQHQYSASKPFGGPESDAPYTTDHYNNRDCVRCHTHNTAFKSILGVCGDCHGFKGTKFSPVSKTTMVKVQTNALGTNPPDYGAHQSHNYAKMACAVCHSNTNHGLPTHEDWLGDDKMEIGFNVSYATYSGFNRNASVIGGVFEGTQNLNYPYTWLAGPGTTINQVPDYNASCNNYCHGGWAGNTGSTTKPNWVGTGQAACGTCHYATLVEPPLSGSHETHAGTGATGLGRDCRICHGTYTQAQYTGAKHINGNVQWDLSAVSAVAKYNGLNAGSTGALATDNSANYKTCTNMYCHSNVQGANGIGAPTTYSEPLWGDNGAESTTVSCNSCHQYPNEVGGHKQHTSSEEGVDFDCHVCHNNGGRTSPLNHADLKIDFEFAGLGESTVYSKGNSVTPGTGYGSCSTSHCHGDYTRAWGPATALAFCDKCHGSATSPRGFYDTTGPDGTLSIYSTGVGMHDIHIQNLNSPRKATFSRFTSFAAGMSCNQCHYNPQGPFSPGHIDNALPAEVPFGHMSSIANKGDSFGYYSSPTYSFASQSCSSVWCHGSGMQSNTAKGEYAGKTPYKPLTPVWNEPNLASGDPCLKCHAMPPAASDSNDAHWNVGANRPFILTECVGCHQHLNTSSTGFTNKALHVNGKIDGGCTGCHGDPPSDPGIGTETGLARPAQNALPADTAGAHIAHMNNANIQKNCYTCHDNYNPVMVDDGNGKLEIGFNAFNGKSKGGTFYGYTNSVNGPQWLTSNAETTITKVNGTTGQEANRCANLYCHGSTITSGSLKTPSWELTGQADCGTCHGGTNADVPFPAQTGAHTRHAGATNLGLACESCHGQNAASMAHVDGVVAWDLDPANPKIGPTATYKSAASGNTGALASGTNYGTCTTFYCHSNVQGAGGIGAPTVYKTMTWGTGSALTCSDCHLSQVGTGTASHAAHTALYGGSASCGYCHHEGGDSTEKHADGMIYVNITTSKLGAGVYTGDNRVAGSAAGYGNCSNVICHGAATIAWGANLGTKQCQKCHGSKSAAFLTVTSAQVAPGYGADGIATDGTTAASARRVGAHQRHLLTGVLSTNVKCSECHVKVTNITDSGHLNYTTATLTFAGRATGNGHTTAATGRDANFTITCSNLWCHTAKSNSGTVPVPVWTTTGMINETTLSVASCTACHGFPPKTVGSGGTSLSYDHTAITNPTGFPVTTCTSCHANFSQTGTTYDSIFTLKSQHLNGSIEAVMNCASCHDYDVNGVTWGGVKNANYAGNNQGIGAHYKHIVYLKAKYNVALSNNDTWASNGYIRVCGTCHSITATDHSTGTPTNPRSITFGDNVTNPRNFGGTPLYNGNSGTSSAVNPKSCSNTDCHYRTSPVWSTY